jgi:hypothetical protein
VKTKWTHIPRSANSPAAYHDSARDMLVIERADKWSAYHLKAGTVVEGAFQSAAEARQWCEARCA